LTSDAWAAERQDVLNRFLKELSKATGDGSKKRQSGAKPPWYQDSSHEGAIFSHLTKWKRGETVDPDSGAHPLVHAAWRCLAIACQESGNVPVKFAVIDGGGDAWTLRHDGLYRLEWLGDSPGRTLEYIAENYGLKGEE
jgi:dATP/dGTP diphosphohydrolase